MASLKIDELIILAWSGLKIGETLAVNRRFQCHRLHISLNGYALIYGNFSWSSRHN